MLTILFIIIILSRFYIDPLTLLICVHAKIWLTTLIGTQGCNQIGSWFIKLNQNHLPFHQEDNGLKSYAKFLEANGLHNFEITNFMNCVYFRISSASAHSDVKSFRDPNAAVEISAAVSCRRSSWDLRQMCPIRRAVAAPGFGDVFLFALGKFPPTNNSCHS